LELIPAISPIAPFAAVAPLIIVLTISMIREGYEDYQRHKSDNEINATKAIVLEFRKNQNK
jgi:phospholipid-transporting ATPase